MTAGEGEVAATANDIIVEPLRAAPSRTRRLFGTLTEDKVALASMGFLSLVIIGAVFAPILAPASPSAIDLSARLAPPVWLPSGTWEHPLGGDALGRDVLSRIIYGARVSLTIGLTVVLAAGIVGSSLGMIAGYLGGKWDTIIMRLADAQLAFPGLLLMIIVIGVLGPSIPVVIAVIALYGWMVFARVIRSNVLTLKETLYVRAAELSGVSSRRIIFKHIGPGLVSPLLTQGTLEFARVILAEAALSYLGLGIQPPDASWGLMVAENQPYMVSGWWTVFFPGVVVALTVLALNLVANWGRLRSDPRQRLLLTARKTRFGATT